MWLSDMRVVLPDRILERGSLCIENGRIAEIVDGPVEHAGVRARGLTAIPGVIDLHGDMIEREIDPRPGVRLPFALAALELDKRLASTGITTAYASVSFWEVNRPGALRSGERARGIIETIHGLHDRLLTDMQIHARFEITTPDVARSLLPLIDAKCVQLVSLMDHTPGQGQYRDLERYLTTIAEWRSVSREEAQRELDERMERRRVIGNIWSVAQQVAGAALAKSLPVASHDDDTVAKVDLVQSLGVTISEFPVSLEAADAARRRGMHLVMGAPNLLRGASTTGNLSAEEALHAGLVDVLAADYYPAAMVQCAFKLARSGILPLTESVKLIGQNAAAAAGLTDRGRIAVGASADLALVEESDIPRVRGTIRRGLPVYWDAYMNQLAGLHGSGNGHSSAAGRLQGLETITPRETHGAVHKPVP